MLQPIKKVQFFWYCVYNVLFWIYKCLYITIDTINSIKYAKKKSYFAVAKHC